MILAPSLTDAALGVLNVAEQAEKVRLTASVAANWVGFPPSYYEPLAE